MILHCGDYVMFRDDAPMAIKLIWGSEAVMQVMYQDGAMPRTYALRHQHKGRLIHGMPAEHLRKIEPEQAQGQIILHRAATQELVRIAREEGLL